MNKQKIIQEWDCDLPEENSSINNLIDFTYPKKLGQINSESGMIGINSNNIILLDGRVNRPNKVVEPKKFDNNPLFTSITTTCLGGIAVGAENGDIRLFNEMGRFTKTLLEGDGEPIRALDITNDGNFILATCDKYILVLNANNEFEQNGFMNCFKKIQQKPVILKMTPFDLMKYNVKNESFTPAKFNNSIKKKEILIISSLGQYIIMWNFEQIKKGEINSYKVVHCLILYFILK